MGARFLEVRSRSLALGRTSETLSDTCCRLALTMILAKGATSFARCERVYDRIAMARDSVTNHTEDGPRIGILVMSAIADDPRVRRQGDLFTAAGWFVKGFGIKGARSSEPAWSVYNAPPPLNRSDLRPFNRAMYRLRLILHSVGVRTGTVNWQKAYWRSDVAFDALYHMAREHRCDVWLANDWTVIPIARRIAEEQGTQFLYDAHELAAEEFSERWRWRLFQRPIVVAIESACIRDAAFVTCVSEGIAESLQRSYRLRDRPTVVRNTPHYQSIEFRPVGEKIEVLYHGILAPGRGLKACIRSVAHWRQEFRLTIRGVATAEYLTSLKSLIATLGLNDRVRLVPPVPMIDLVREAALFDVGLLALPGHSRHNQFALPNKIFEYAMGGLALCVSDLPEMARIVRKYDLGVTISATEPEAIATAINGLDRNRVNLYKENSLAAARMLNFETEGAQLVSAAKAVLHHSVGNHPIGQTPIQQEGD
jgi:glycosyltransferase involved in cell wall biosynthesis